MSKEERRSKEEKKHKRHKKDHHKMKKKKKKQKYDNEENRKHSRRSQNGEIESPDYDNAFVIVRELLLEFPALMGELVSLLQMLDEGETVVIGGIQNEIIRSKLHKLFPLLGLKQRDEIMGSFSKRSSMKSISLLEFFEEMLAGEHRPVESSSQQEEQKIGNGIEEKTTPIRRSAPIGPAMPPSRSIDDTNNHAHIRQAKAAEEEEEEEEGDEEDGIIGPALPGEKGFRMADERVEAEMARQAKELERSEWNRARGIVTEDDQTNGSIKREDWMTMMPSTSILKDSFFAPSRGQSGKPAQFRSKEPQQIDRSWFDAPEERDRAKRAKMDIELLGYVREENQPIGQASTVANPVRRVNESIVPAANSEKDEEVRQQMEELRQNRGLSLMQQHQENLKKKQIVVAKGGQPSSSTWNRERDLVGRREMNKGQAEELIRASKEISSRFTSPSITRQFL